MPVPEPGRARAEGGKAGPAWPLFRASHSSPFARQPGQGQFSHPGAQASSPAHDLPDREPSARFISQRDMSRRPARPRLMFMRFPPTSGACGRSALIVLGRALARDGGGGRGASIAQHRLCASSSPLVTMLRLLPMGLFGAFLGAFVEALRAGALIARRQMVALLAADVDRAGGHRGAGDAAGLAPGRWRSFVNGFGWAHRQSAAAHDDAATASAASAWRRPWRSTSAPSNASRMVGPTVGGVVLVAGGIEGAFAAERRHLYRRAPLAPRSPCAATSTASRRPQRARVLARLARRHRRRAWRQPPARPACSPSP